MRKRITRRFCFGMSLSASLPAGNRNGIEHNKRSGKTHRSRVKGECRMKGFQSPGSCLEVIGGRFRQLQSYCTTILYYCTTAGLRYSYYCSTTVLPLYYCTTVLVIPLHYYKAMVRLSAEHSIGP